MRIIAIVNQKGGCGKTTTAINLAAVFAARGRRTLLADMDPQAHCAVGLGVPEAQIEYSLAEALTAEHDRSFDPDALIWEVSRNLYLAPSTVRLAALEAPGGGLHQRPDRDRRLASLLRLLDGRFDCCLVDCPPTLGLLTFNALRAAREALIPVETGFFAMKGAHRQWTTIQRTIEHIGRPIACHLLPTLHKPGMSIACDILAALRRDFAGQIVPLVIEEHDALREAASFGQPVLVYAPGSAACADFERLADWLEAHEPDPSGAIQPHGERDPAAFQHHGASRGFAEGAPSSSRAAELARRVRDLASRGDDPPLPVEPDEAQAAPQQPRPAEPVITRPPPWSAPSHAAAAARDAAGPAEPSPAAPGPHGAAPRSVPYASSVAAAPAVAIDAPQRPLPLLREIAGEEPATPPPSMAHLYGVRQTSQGVLFVQPADAGSRLFVAGDFNGWSSSANAMRYNGELKIHQAIIPIEPGVHQYRLVVDGRWQADRYNPDQQHNAYGEPNSVLTVTTARQHP